MPGVPTAKMPRWITCLYACVFVLRHTVCVGALDAVLVKTAAPLYCVALQYFSIAGVCIFWEFVF